ncbi:MAG: hypothetical protein UZ02_AOB001002407 [Nitrosomonas europaea]|nr:MAG: hypothetical protein UZ02_AOB001002407 [Nitrosomonas europaea]
MVHSDDLALQKIAWGCDHFAQIKQIKGADSESITLAVLIFLIPDLTLTMQSHWVSIRFTCADYCYRAFPAPGDNQARS